MTAPDGLEGLTNLLATPAQLSSSSSSLDGIPADLETSIRFAGALLTQAAGVLLRLPQDVVAQAIVIFTRFWIGPDGGSLAIYDAKDVSAASIYLMAKLSFHPTSPRSVLNVYSYLLSKEASSMWFINPSEKLEDKPKPETYYLSEGRYQAQRLSLMKMETIILRTLGFNTHVVIPHTIALTYLQTMNTTGNAFAKRVFEHLNASLLSPQLLYVTHQPNALAVASIYLAAREVGVKMPEEEWWEVFDVDREELGFLVVAMNSMEGFSKSERDAWTGTPIPLTVQSLEAELVRRRKAQDGE